MPRLATPRDPTEQQIRRFFAELAARLVDTGKIYEWQAGNGRIVIGDDRKISGNVKAHGLGLVYQMYAMQIAPAEDRTWLFR